MSDLEQAKKEYLRRNIIVAKAYGVDAGLKKAINRLPKRTPQWLKKLLIIEQAKMPEICYEIVKHRDKVKPPEAKQ